jgi:hypothetical protein
MTNTLAYHGRLRITVVSLFMVQVPKVLHCFAHSLSLSLSHSHSLSLSLSFWKFEDFFLPRNSFSQILEKVLILSLLTSTHHPIKLYPVVRSKLVRFKLFLSNKDAHSLVYTRIIILSPFGQSLAQ